MLEILETEALDDLLRVSKIIKICREKGILFSLDELIFLAIQNYHSFQNLHRYIERNQPTISEFSFEQCSIRYWLIKNKKGLKDEKTFLNLYNLYEKQNVLANKICQLKAREKIEQAREELKKLDEFLGMLLKKLIMAVFES